MARAGDAWRVRWSVTSDPALRLTHVAAPHGKFRAADADIDLATPTELALDVAMTDPPQTDIENTFLILTAGSAERSWRILARMRVRVDDGGVPRPVLERIDVQEVEPGGQG